MMGQKAKKRYDGILTLVINFTELFIGSRMRVCKHDELHLHNRRYC